MHQALAELQRWAGSIVSISCDEPNRCELLLRLRHVSQRPATTLILTFEPNGDWWLQNITRVEASATEVVVHDALGHVTRIARLVLPAGLERALHVGQFDTRELSLPTIAAPFFKSYTPPPPRLRPRNVIVWTEFAALSRLMLWWTCASFPKANLWVAALPREQPHLDENWMYRRARQLMAAAPSLRRLTSKQRAAFAANWNAWSSGDARFREVGLREWPDQTKWLGLIPTPIHDLFPCVVDSGFELSPYDHWILQQLGTEWSSTLATINRIFKTDDRLLTAWGDWGLHRRLHVWSRWKSGRFVQHRPSQTDKAFSGLEYRLTAEGQMLLHGLPELTAAPPFQFGAFRFYVPGSWVMTPRGPSRSNGHV